MKNKASKRLIYGLVGWLICLSFFSLKSVAQVKKTDSTNTGYKIRTIIVDAGHGIRAPGASRFSPGADGSYSLERNVTLAIALKLQQAIEKDVAGVRVVMTRTTPYDVPFQTRADIANENKGDLFISIHCNSLSNRTVHEVVGHKHKKPIYRTVSVPDRSGKGVLLLVYSTKREGPQIEALRENAEIGVNNDTLKQHRDDDPMSVIMINQFKNKYRKQSIHLANLINNEFTQTDGRPSDGLREQVLFVLDHTAMPSVLVETGYINNHQDEDYLNSEAGQTEIAASIVRAIQEYKKEVEQVSQAQ